MRKLDLNEQKVIAVYEKYENARQVSKVFGCSTETVYRILERNGIPRTHRHPKQANVVRVSNCNTKYCPAVIRLLYVVGGYKTSQIADATSIPIASVCNTLRKRYGDVFKSKRDAARNADVDAIEQEYLAGASSCELAEKYGVDRATVSKWMRKRGHVRGKGHGKGAAVLKERCYKRITRKLEEDGGTLELVEYGEKLTLRCKACGHEFKKLRGGYKHRFTCPHCYKEELSRLSKVREHKRERKRYEHEQQREAAREWRLSVPRICKECGEPFWSESEVVGYCCDACRRKANNRRKAERVRANGSRSTSYRRRMRITKTSDTYDSSVTLDAVYKKYRGRCRNCGCKTVRANPNDGWNPKQATLDHIIALANNGTHTWDNVQLLCAKCNSDKRDLGQMRIAI